MEDEQMDAILTARQLGKAIQSDERFMKMSMAQQKSDEDQKLQQMIQEFNQKRMELNSALQEKDKDKEKISVMDTELKAMYQEIFQNENMVAFTAARSEMEQMIAFVNQIVSGSTQGLDPDTIEYQESCGGDCGGCAGCS